MLPMPTVTPPIMYKIGFSVTKPVTNKAAPNKPKTMKTSGFLSCDITV